MVNCLLKVDSSKAHFHIRLSLCNLLILHEIYLENAVIVVYASGMREFPPKEG
jgi:hypothetical protein